VIGSIAPEYVFISGVLFLALLAAILWRHFVGRILDALNDATRTNEELGLIINNTSDGIVLLSMRGKVLWANDPYLAMHDFTLPEILDRNPLTFALPPEDRPPRDEIEAFRFDPSDPQWRELQIYRNIRKDGSLFWNQISLSFHEKEDDEPFVVLVCRDITRQIEAQDALEKTRAELDLAATRDSLTNLANRWSLMECLSALTRRVAAGDIVKAAVLQVDIDLFKQINDTHGHVAGDAVLCHVADVLAARADDDTLVARPGGDEFIVVIDGMSDPDLLKELADRLYRDISTGIYWQGRFIPTSVSIGGALFEPGDTEPDTVLIRSDYALYQAKRTGRGRAVIYDDTVRSRHERANRLGRHLRNEIEEGDLEFEFQPKLNVVTGEISGVETLVRWQHPTEGRLTPDRFLDLAVENGLMAELDYAAIDSLFTLGEDLAAEGRSDMRLAFNASPQLLADPDFLSRLSRKCREHRLEPDHVIIEILETVILSDGPSENPIMQTIRKLHGAGFRIVLDDFGTGHAGLAHLTELPISGIKIDRSLVRRIFEDETSHKIVLAIAELCNDLGLGLVGEGVETRETAEWLSLAGCDRLQGFWISPAIGADAFRAFLARHDPARFRLPQRGSRPASTGRSPNRALRLHGAS